MAPETDPDLRERDLWRRLVRGECSRIFVLGEEAWPTVGNLPRIAPYDYVRYSDGVYGPQTDMPTLARQLAEEERWIASGLSWGTMFMPRAEVILSIEDYRTSMNFGEPPAMGLDPANLRRAFRGLRRRGARRTSEDGWFDAALEMSRTPVKLWQLQAFAEEQYPEKLIHVQTMGGTMQLLPAREREARRSDDG